MFLKINKRNQGRILIGQHYIALNSIRQTDYAGREFIDKVQEGLVLSYPNLPELFNKPFISGKHHWAISVSHQSTRLKSPESVDGKSEHQVSFGPVVLIKCNICLRQKTFGCPDIDLEHMRKG